MTKFTEPHMTNQQQPITPPPELVKQLRDDAVFGGNAQQSYELRLITAAYHAGADQMLEACVEWLQDPDLNVDTYKLRAALRPEPPSLKKQAYDAAELSDKELERQFQVWWHNEGSGMPPCADEDQEEHVHRVSQTAWHHSAYCARWGRPAPQPVPVSEHLPGLSDRNAQGECWWFNRAGIPEWQLADGGPYGDYWLPAHALPIPDNTNDSN